MLDLDVAQSDAVDQQSREHVFKPIGPPGRVVGHLVHWLLPMPGSRTSRRASAIAAAYHDTIHERKVSFPAKRP
jgi:hypothetical protein